MYRSYYVIQYYVKWLRSVWLHVELIPKSKFTINKVTLLS